MKKDEIHYPPPRPSMYNILGGAGTYSALGARLFSLAVNHQSQRVAWIVDIGSDFPTTPLETIKSWQTSAILRHDETRLTTRGWNSIAPSGYRDFKYLTEKKRLDAEDLVDPAILRSKSFHFICSPDRCVELVASIQAKRKALDSKMTRPIYIWEPVPGCMVSEELLNLTRALPYIDICSPNAAELGQLLGYASEEVESASGDANPDFVETATTQLLESMPLSSYAIVVRCGKSGLYVGKNGGRSSRVSFFEAEAEVSGEEDATETNKEKPSKDAGKRVKLSRSLKTFTANTLSAPTPAVKPAKHMHGGLTADTDMMALFAHLDTANNDSDEDYETDDDEDNEEEVRTTTRRGADDEPDSEIPIVQLSQHFSSSTQEQSDGEDSKLPLEIHPDYGMSLWLPAYHTSIDKVVDPTGGGNAFLGGLAVSLARGKGLETACAWASVAASFAIEQVGMPLLKSDNGKELWNGSDVWERLRSFQERI